MLAREREVGEPRAIPVSGSPERAERQAPWREHRTLYGATLRPLGDAAAGAIAYLLALLLRYRLASVVDPRLTPVSFHQHLYTAAFWLYLPLLVVCLGGGGAYRRTAVSLAPPHYRAVVQGVTFALLVLLMATYLFDRAAVLSRGWLLSAWVLTLLLVAGGRLLAGWAVGQLAAAGLIGRRALVVGTHDEGRAIEWVLRRQRRLGLQVAGFIDDALPVGAPLQRGKAVLGGMGELHELIERHAIDVVLVSARASGHAQMLTVVEATVGTLAQVVVSPDVFTVLNTAASVETLPGMPLVAVSKTRLGSGERLVKGILDRLVAALLLVALAPLLVALAAVVRHAFGGVFERHPTLGLGGAPFGALKFRTTPRHADGADEPTPVALRRHKGLPVRDNPHLTPLGRTLRRSSLDELPQLLNVLRGQMSLVGPYKIAPRDRRHYGGRWVSVLTLKPGITGMAQVHGRGELTMEERSLLDAEYVRDYSLWRDLALLLATIPAALRGRGAF